MRDYSYYVIMWLLRLKKYKQQELGKDAKTHEFNRMKLIRQIIIPCIALLFSCNRTRLSRVNSDWMILCTCLAFFNCAIFANTEFLQISSIGIWLVSCCCCCFFYCCFFSWIEWIPQLRWFDFQVWSGVNVLDLFIYFCQPDKFFLWLPSWLFKIYDKATLSQTVF